MRHPTFLYRCWKNLPLTDAIVLKQQHPAKGRQQACPVLVTPAGACKPVTNKIAQQQQSGGAHAQRAQHDAGVEVHIGGRA